MALYGFSEGLFPLPPDITPVLGDGRGLAIDSDVNTRRILLQVNNEEIYVLSSEFIGVIPAIVSIDIKPHSINPRSKGVIPVAILTTKDFDATDVDPLSVQFGPNGGFEAHGKGHSEDVNHDGKKDLVLHFRTHETGIRCGDRTAFLTRETFEGTPIQGSDSIGTVDCK
jgi:hypothetical protein